MSVIQITLMTLALLVIVGCSVSTETGEKPVVKETSTEPSKKDSAETVNKTEAVSRDMPEKKTDATKSDLKPEDISLDKPFDPTELTVAVAAEEEAWKGKQVTVRGKIGGGFNKNPDGSITFYIMNKENQPQIICRGTKPPPDDAASNEKTYKATVEKVSDGMRGKELHLKSCENIK